MSAFNIKFGLDFLNIFIPKNPVSISYVSFVSNASAASVKIAANSLTNKSIYSFDTSSAKVPDNILPHENHLHQYIVHLIPYG